VRVVSALSAARRFRPIDLFRLDEGPGHDIYANGPFIGREGGGGMWGDCSHVHSEVARPVTINL
jgi:hypothetical protein